MTDKTTCRSCGKMTTSPNGRWNRSIRHGEPIGWTCPGCPRFGEPIIRKETGDGLRFKVTLQRGFTSSGRRQTETKTFTSLSAARDHLAIRGAQVRKERSHGHKPLDRTTVTVNDVCDDYLTVKADDVRLSTLETYRHALKPVRAHLGDRKVQSLRIDDVVKFTRWLPKSGGRNGQGLGKHASRATIATLKGVLDLAVSEGLIVVNPARDPKVKLPRIESGDGHELERWTASELVTFVGHGDTTDQAVAWRLISLGLRREEVLGLQWDAVDFKNGTIRIKRSRVKVSKSTDARGWVVGPVKTQGTKHNAALRTIHPDDVLPGTMRALKALRLRSGSRAGFVVLDEGGEPMRPDTFSSRFTATCKAAGVPTINVHSTRHTVAYILHDANVPPVRAAAYLGHTLEVHIGIYLFARADDVTVTGQALGAALKVAASAS